jgi:cell division protease FtsH
MSLTWRPRCCLRGPSANIYQILKGCCLCCVVHPPVIVVRAPVAEFEERLGKLLEKGLVMPFALSLVDAFGDRSLSGRYRDNVSDPHRAISVSGKTVRAMTPKAIREALAKASLRKQLPIIIVDETGADDFPKRLFVSADLVLETGGIDRSLLADLLHVCLDMPPKVSLADVDACAFHPGALGLDDLVLALRPGRSGEDILGVLTELGKASEAEDEENTEGESGGWSRKIKHRSHEKPGNLSRKQSDCSTALTQPEAPPSEKTTTSSTTGYLSVEMLAGYGQARD